VVFEDVDDRPVEIRVLERRRRNEESSLRRRGTMDHASILASESPRATFSCLYENA